MESPSRTGKADRYACGPRYPTTKRLAPRPCRGDDRRPARLRSGRPLIFAARRSKRFFPPIVEICIMFEILPEGPDDGPAIDSLLTRAFGPTRHDRTVYRLREGVSPLADLAFVARDRDGLAGSLRFWPVEITDAWPALLLGPLAVAAERQGRGIGRALVRHGLETAREHGHGAVLLVGDPDYYRHFGFRPVAGLSLPGPVDPRRLQALELAPGGLAAGPVRQPRRWLRAAGGLSRTSGPRGTRPAWRGRGRGRAPAALATAPNGRRR